MTNLTEQYSKGELEEGYYYVKSDWFDGVDIRYIHNRLDDWKEILDSVPTYDEYIKLLSDSVAKIEGEEINAELQEENARLKKWCEEFNALDVAKENTKLKELLKEVLRHELSLKEVTELTRKISEVLGEE